jgi:predicted RNA-binding Zn-ribbon protein involved in translation (DUF1610 family)
MDLNAFLLTLGLPGFFSSRAFTPAFVTALILRYGDSLPVLKEIEFLRVTGSEPTWFTNNWTILALGLLAALELLATKSPEAEEMLGQVHKYAKTGMAFLTTMGIVQAGELDYFRDLFRTADLTLNGWAAVVAGATFLLTSLRNGVVFLLAEADPEDVLGLRRLISWFEDTWGAVGLLFLVLYPLVMLLVVAALAAGLYGMRRYAEYMEEKNRVPCGACGTPIYASAPHCPQCGAVHPTPCDVGLFGQAKRQLPARPGRAHALRLASKRRCPRCATRLPERSTRQTCPACGTAPFGEIAFREAYTGMVTGRLPKVLGLSFLFGLVPVLGMIPGILYYRIALLAPYRGYLSAGRAFVLRWLLRIVFLFLIAAQGSPLFLLFAAPPAAPLALLVGALTVPLMALLSYGVYRGAFGSALSETPVA